MHRTAIDLDETLIDEHYRLHLVSFFESLV